LQRALHALGRALEGTARFIVRAWIAIVLIAYAVLFLALLVGVVFARSSGDSRGGRGGVGVEFGYFFFRILADAGFWAFHPFSPFPYDAHEPMSWGYEASRVRRRGHRRDPNEPRFYDKVNRFFFGPDPPRRDPRAIEKKILAEIRAE